MASVELGAPPGGVAAADGPANAVTSANRIRRIAVALRRHREQANCDA
jgi:hypothetical protein